MNNICIIRMKGFKNIRRKAFLYDSGNISTFLIQYANEFKFTDGLEMQLVINPNNLPEFNCTAIVDKHQSIMFNCSDSEAYLNIYLHTLKPISNKIITEFLDHFRPDRYEIISITDEIYHKIYEFDKIEQGLPVYKETKEFNLPEPEKKIEEEILEEEVEEPTMLWTKPQLLKYCKENNIEVKTSNTKPEILEKINETEL